MPGLSLGVSQGGKIIHQFNYGFSDIEGSIRTDSDTIYGIGSVTKTFTATAIVQLVSTGKLQWKTPIKDILPEFASRNPVVSSEATIEDLLTHRMALSRSNNWWYGSDGDLLLSKTETLQAYSQLKPIGSFRAQFDYSNWHYTVAGEIIERVTGQSYGEYIDQALAKPLGLKHTSAVHSMVPEHRVAKPYVALDNLDFHLLPRPQAQNGTIMGPAQGILSSVNDLLDYGTALLDSAKKTTRAVTDDETTTKLKDIDRQISGHIFTTNSLLESSYGLGVFRHQLPGSICGTGANAMFVKELPQVIPRGDTRLVISHPGSLAGYTSFFVLLPEINSVVVVLTNSIGLADPAAWIAHVMVEALVDSPSPADIMAFVNEASKNHIQSYPKVQAVFDELAANSTVPENLTDYVGTYIYTGDLDFKVQIRLVENDTLQVAFQGLDSQVWNLNHLEGDTFHWLTSRDHQAKKAKFTYPFLHSLFKIAFQRGENGHISHLIWAHDGAVPPEEQLFKKQEAQEKAAGTSNL